MYRDTKVPEVLDSENRGYDVSTEVVENQNFPYWLPVVVQDGGG
jgi:hypothetical protein